MWFSHEGLVDSVTYVWRHQIFWLQQLYRYLCASGQSEKANKALRTIAQYNNVMLPKGFTVQTYQDQELGKWLYYKSMTPEGSTF